MEIVIVFSKRPVNRFVKYFGTLLLDKFFIQSIRHKYLGVTWGTWYTSCRTGDVFIYRNNWGLYRAKLFQLYFERITRPLLMLLKLFMFILK